MHKIIILLLSLFFIASCKISKENTPKNIILISKDSFYPEGVASDKFGNLYVGSLKYGSIYKVGKNKHRAKSFISSDEGKLMSVIGMKVDKNNILWVCSSDPGVSIFTKKYNISLKKIDLGTKSVLNSYSLPGGGFCNDITIDNGGNVYITDSFNPRILVLESNSSKLKTFISSKLFSGDGISLNGIDFDGKSNLYVVKYNDGRLFRVNILNKKIEEISLPRPLFTADGLKYVDNRLIVVEGASVSSRNLATAGNGKITEIFLLPKNKAKLNILKEGLDVPTTFTVMDNKVYVVESQYDHLFKYKDLDPSSFFIRVFEIN